MAPLLGEHDRAPLTKALADDSSEVRRLTLEAWFGLRTAPGIAALSELVRDESEGVRMAALRVWSTVPSESFDRELRQALYDPSISVRLQAATLLCERGALEGASILIAEGECLTALNFLDEGGREALVEGRIHEELHGNRMEVVRGAIASAGMKLSVPDRLSNGSQIWGERKIEIQIGSQGRNLFEVLAIIFESGRAPLCPIIHKGRCEVIEKADALRYWNDWLHSRTKTR